MKNRIFKISLIALMLTTLTGCELIGDIFQAGVGVGVFIVVIILIAVIWIISRLRK